MKRGLILLALALVFGSGLFAAEATVYRDGTYSIDYHDEELGDVSVAVQVEGGKISSVSFPKGKGDVTLEDADLAAWLATFVAAPNFMDVDAVSGASQSCDLVKYAVLAALKGAKVK